jgi:aminopeptidase N
MKSAIFQALHLTLLSSCVETSYVPGPGVPLTLAESRKESVSGLEYDLTFDIPETITSDIPASAVIRFRYTGNGTVVLDFKESPQYLESVTLNDRAIVADLVEEHLILPGNLLQENNTVEIQFIAGDLSLNRNEDYLYTLLVPDRARTLFPVMDQPNLKARYTLTLMIPGDWEALANGPLDKVSTEQGRKIIHYRQTRPVSSYLFAFAAGKFQKLTNLAGDMTMYYRELDSTKVQLNATEIFDLHRKSLDWMESYTGLPYPFQKFDFALIPTFQYGGMEHPGAIFYRERLLMLDEAATVNERLRWASLIAHETAHMWFGDLVTMDWFDDVWLKEVFANFMAAKMVNPHFPEIDHDLRFLLAHYPAAYAVDRSAGTHAIRQPLDNLQDAGSLYGAIIYQKAPVVMRNLETLIGEDRFQKGLQEYLDTFSYGNATWDDLIGILNRYTDQDLAQWNNDWVKSGGMPVISVSREQDALKYRVSNARDGQVWSQKLETRVGKDLFSFQLDLEYQHKVSGEAFTVNSDGRGYGYFDLDSSFLVALQQSMHTSDDLLRASRWMMLWEHYLRHFESLTSFPVDLIAAIDREDNPLILEYLTGCLKTVNWIFLDQDQRNEIREPLESVLYMGLTSREDASLQRIFFQAYASMVQSRPGIANLRKLWAGELRTFELPLSENDRIDLALQLAIREGTDAGEILRTQQKNIQNPDNLRRWEFLLPSVAQEPAVRDSFFRTLLRGENRSQELWVSEALSYLHHPLRAEASLRYLRPALDIIEEIKHTGDIFFPKAWLDASLSGHRSPKAARMVRDFLAGHPDLPPDLRQKVLQSADLLLRLNPD